MNLSFAHLWFKFIHQNFLIYNMCWEDVKVDRSLLNLDYDSKIMMITSAGCNALTYLLDQPASIHSVDINPKQTALFDLKIQIIKSENYRDFYEFFWNGKSINSKHIYDSVKSNLSKESQEFWDSHIHYFDINERGLFFQGGAGYFARFLNKIIGRKNLRTKILILSTEPDQAKRSVLFREIEEELWSGLEKMIWSSNTVLSLAGIPDSQQRAIGNLSTFTKDVIRRVFIDRLVDSNPYWGRYLNIPEFEPSKQDIHHSSNFEVLKRNISRINFGTSSFNEFLNSTTKKFTHFVLLDHMDWMVGRKENELPRLWKLIHQSSEKSSKVLFRTAFSDLNFLPKNAFRHFCFERIDDSWIKEHDRVGSYTSTFLGFKK